MTTEPDKVLSFKQVTSRVPGHQRGRKAEWGESHPWGKVTALLNGLEFTQEELEEQTVPRHSHWYGSLPTGNTVEG